VFLSTSLQKNTESKTLFIKCPLVDSKCAMCGESNWNPMTDSYNSTTYLHCGMLTGYETRVDSLEKCWLKMEKKEQAKFKKQKKNEYYALNPSKMHKTRVTYY